MNKLIFGTALILTFTLPHTAKAQGFLDSLERAVSKIDNTVSRTENTVDRAQGTAERLNNRIPESGAEEPAETITYEPTPTQQATQQKTMTPQEEEAILEQARKIEEERILREAEKIRAQRANQ